MTVEHLAFAEEYQSESDIQQIEFCDAHHSTVRALLIERGFGEDCELSDDERREMLLAGNMDAMTEMTQTLMVGVLSVFGGEAMARHLGCPVCVLEGTPERAADEIAARRTRKN
jgi:hypothetical protein